MASDQEVAQQILGIQPAQAVAENMPPEALMANPPEALAAPIANDVVIPSVDPATAAAAQQADANAQQQMNTLQFGYTPPGQRPADISDVLLTPAQVKQRDAEFAQPQAVEPEPVVEPAMPVQPTPEQTDAAHQEVVAPVQQAIAEHRATKIAQRDLQAEFAKQQEEYQKQQDDIKAEIAKRDDFVRQKSIPEIMQKGSFGEKMTATIALLLGGLSQGLTGAKSNPVMDFIDKQVEVQAQRDKLSAENKLALKKNLMDLAQLKMHNVANQSQDLFHKQSLEQEAAKIAVERQKVEGDQAIKAAEMLVKASAKQTAAQAESGAPLADLSQLSEDQRKRVVARPDGSYVLAKVGHDQVDAFQKTRSEIEPGISGIDRILELTQNFNRVTDLKKRAQIGSEVKALAGSLRVPFTGPGALTEREYDRLLDILGNPNNLAAIPSLQLARLKQVRTKLSADLENGFKRIGVDLPKSREDQLITNLKQKGYSEDAIRKVLNKQK